MSDHVGAGLHPMKRKTLSNAATAAGQCLCGAVRFEIDIPARWAWHDHRRDSRTARAREVARYEDEESGSTRGFCRRCGTPVTFERAHSPHMVNIPRALFL